VGESESIGILSIVPASIAVILAFATRNTVFSLAVACTIGVLLLGEGLLGFPNLLVNVVGTTDFSYIFLFTLFIGVAIAFFQRTGAIKNFGEYVENKKMSRVRVQVTTWLMGMFVFFSDYLSPLFVGSTMRALSDKFHISREKLAYIADSTSAPVVILIPISGWAVFVAGLLIGKGPIGDMEDAMSVFVAAIPYNIYPILAVSMVGLIATGILPDFGPMKTAEDRARTTGKVLRDGAKPLMEVELTEIEPYEGVNTSLFWNFVFPVVIVVVIAVASFSVTGSSLIMEAFLASAVVAGIIMAIQGIPLSDIMDTFNSGIKGIMPAAMILVFAYALNSLSASMGTAVYIVSLTESWLIPGLLPTVAFLMAGVIAFSTGTSWGTFAIILPIAVPLAFGFTGGDQGPLIYATVAAVAGGGVFGDHCSPISDTSILASTGAASDHIDHVKTQLPYALIVGAISIIVYLVMGLTI
jgi:Na+/H+ antiporter NhaC